MELDLDVDTAFFAVFDGHGGSEVSGSRYLRPGLLVCRELRLTSRLCFDNRLAAVERSPAPQPTPD